MSVFLTLFKVELKSILNLQSFKTWRKTDLKSLGKMLGFFAIIILGVIYIGGYAWLLAQSGLSKVLLPMGFMMGCMLIFFTTIYKASGALFKNSDYDLLMSMPISIPKIVSVKLSSLYVAELGFVSILMIPIYVIYVEAVGFDGLQGLMFILSFLFIPLVPLMIGIFIGFICTSIASVFKQSNLINVVLCFTGIIIFYSFIYMQDPNQDVDGLINMSDYMLGMFNQYYPLTGLYNDAVMNASFSALIAFILISVGICLVFIYLISSQYKRLNVLARTSLSKNNYQMAALKTNSSFKVLYKKEVKKYLSSSTYIMNTFIGCIVALFFGVGVAFFNIEIVEMFLTIDNGHELVCLFMGFMLSAFLILCCTTCTSISAEAPQLWLIKSLPIRALDIFHAKLALNYTLIIPSSLLSSGLIIYGAGLSGSNALFLILLPLSMCIFQPIWGLYFNVKFPKYDWTSEIKLYKQSLSVFVTQIGSMFLIMGLGGLCGYLYLVKEVRLVFLLSILVFIMLGLSIVLYQLLKKELIRNDE